MEEVAEIVADDREELVARGERVVGAIPLLHEILVGLFALGAQQRDLLGALVFTAFLGGYSILERHNHSFYISHYVKGLDATVADGGFDLRFANDTDHAIVIRASMTPKTMTIVFLSHPTGRTVSWTTGAESNFSKPKTRHIADSETAPKTIDQQTLGERGFDITVRRTVHNADGSVLRAGDFPSHYTAEDIVFKVGKGAQLPAGTTFEGPADWVAKTGTTTGATDTTGTGTVGTGTTGTGTTQSTTDATTTATTTATATTS